MRARASGADIVHLYTTAGTFFFQLSTASSFGLIIHNYKSQESEKRRSDESGR